MSKWCANGVHVQLLVNIYLLQERPRINILLLTMRDLFYSLKPILALKMDKNIECWRMSQKKVIPRCMQNLSFEIYQNRNCNICRDWVDFIDMSFFRTTFPTAFPTAFPFAFLHSKIRIFEKNSTNTKETRQSITSFLIFQESLLIWYLIFFLLPPFFLQGKDFVNDSTRSASLTTKRYRRNS